MKGDRIVAYAKGFGAIGWGQIEKTNYRLVTSGSDADRMNGELRHRLRIAGSTGRGVRIHSLTTSRSALPLKSTNELVIQDDSARSARDGCRKSCKLLIPATFGRDIRPPAQRP